MAESCSRTRRASGAPRERWRRWAARRAGSLRTWLGLRSGSGLGSVVRVRVVGVRVRVRVRVIGARVRVSRCVAHQASFERNCSSMQLHAASSSLVSSARPSIGARSSRRQSAAQQEVGIAQKWQADSARGSSNTSSSLVCNRTAMSYGKRSPCAPVHARAAHAGLAWRGHGRTQRTLAMP